MRNLLRLFAAAAPLLLLCLSSYPTAVFSSGGIKPSVAGATINVNSTSDAAANDGLCTLREAIASANTNAASGAAAGECAAGGAGDDAIDFSVTGTITLLGVLPDLSSDISINGPGAKLLNVARGTGGAYRVFTVTPGATVNIYGLTVSGGHAPDGASGAAGQKGGDGGGINNAGTLTLTAVAVSGNRAGDGGSSSQPSSNGGDGGGGGGVYNSGALKMSGCTLGGNQTGAGGTGGRPDADGYKGSGGGLFNAGALSAVNSTFSGNNARVGGGMWDEGSPSALTNCTVADNSADGDGRGVVSFSFTSVANTIIGHNSGPGADAGGLFSSQGHNVVGSESGAPTGCCVFFTQPTDKIGTENARLDPGVALLADNGGPTQTHALLPTSPALDAGGNSLAKDANNNALTTDQRGASRIAGATATVDTGAYEYHAALEDVPDKTTPEDAALSFSFDIGDGVNATSVTASSDNQTLAPDANLSVTGAGPVRTLSVTPAANRSGAAHITLTVTDSMSNVTGDSFTLTVADVNDAPTFTKGADQTAPEDAGAQAVMNWATAVSPGPDEAGQSASFQVTGDTNPGLFSSAPSVSPSGTLAYTPAANANGSATITLVLKDNGGASNGGQDTSAPQTFVVNVTPVNDAPTALDLSNTTVADNSHGTTTIGTLSTTHPDAGETFTYTLVSGVGDTDNLFFFINGSTLTGGNFDFETKPVYAARIRSTDSNGDFIEKAFLITVADGPDSTGAISFTAPGFSVSESGGSATIRLARTGGSDNRVTAKVNLSDVTTSAADYVFAPGSLDTSFNPGGEGASSHSSGLAQYVAALAYQVDGKAVVGGAFLFYNGLQRGRLARVESDGSLDTSFDSGVGANGPVNAIALQPDGKVIIAGAFTTYNNVSRNRIARLNDDGTLDTTFNTSGPNGNLYVLAMQHDGKILVGGTFNSFGGSSARKQIVRLNSDGSPDPDFNPVGTNFAGVDSDAVQAIAPQPDGKILVGGGFIEFGGVTNTRVLRLNSDGSVDNTFTPSTGISMAVRDIILQPDGKSIVVGEFIGNDTPYGRRGVVRLNADGTVDGTFDPGTGTNGGTVESVAPQPDGKLVIGGWFTSYNGTSINRLARLNTDGSLDAAFNPGDGANSPVRDVLVQPGGRVLVGGQHTFYNNTSSNGLTRVRGDLFVTWNPGETFDRAIALPIVDDSTAESNETLTLTLTTFGAPAGSPSTSTLTINDNETAVSAVSGTGPYSGTATLTATLTAGGSPLPGKSVTLTLGGTTGSATTNANGVATLSGATTQGLTPGSYPNVVGASFAGDSSYTGSSGTGALTVNKADTTTTVTVSNATYDGNPHGATATVTGPGGLNQSLPVTYAGSGPYGPTATPPTFVGDYTASASYAGSSNYNASGGSKSYQITKGSQTITFAALADKTLGDADFTVSASASSGLAVSFSAAGNCSLVSSTTVRVTGAGSCTITASQPGDANYNAAANVARSFSIAKANQTITFNGIQNKIYGAPDFRLFAQTSSALVPTFATVGQCVMTTPTGNTVHITGAGSCAITASQAGNANFNAAPDVSRSFQIAKAGTLTAVSSSANPSAFGQSVTFTAAVTSTTSGAGTPTGAVQFEIDGANVGGPAALDANGVATFTASSLSAGAHGVTAKYGGGSNFEASAGSLAAGQQVGSFIGFSQSSYSVNEGASLTVTVRRTGDTTQAASVDYATDDGSTPSVVVPCSTTAGIALDRCDYTKAIGTLRFASGEAEKTFVVLGGDDSYTEGPETAALKLSNPSAGSALVPNPTALFTINDDSPESTGNPTDDDEKFVTQHYRDFLNRDPDAAGLNFWKGQITSCGSNSACRDVRRINVSAAFFLSIEFQETGYLVYRAYKTAYGDATSPNVAGAVPVIRLDEFLPDTQRIGQGVVVGVGNWQQTLEANKRDYFAAFISRARFENAYPTTLSPAQFVNSLFLNAGVTPTTAERNAAVAEFGTSSNTGDQLVRARVLRSVAEHPALAEAEKNRAFVLMEYYGYLRRNPNDAPEPTLNFAGWRFWLTKLEQFNGDFVKAEMVKAFISSDEYRHRFGQ